MAKFLPGETYYFSITYGIYDTYSLVSTVKTIKMPAIGEEVATTEASTTEAGNTTETTNNTGSFSPALSVSTSGETLSFSWRPALLSVVSLRS